MPEVPGVPAAPEPALAPVRIYRFAFIKELRVLLRLKVLQLGLGVGVVFPAYSLYTAGSQEGLPL